MNESDYIGVYTHKPKKYFKLSNLQKALIIEEYVNDKSNCLEKLAVKYGSNVHTISKLITEILFNVPINPLVITLKSAV